MIIPLKKINHDCKKRAVVSTKNSTTFWKGVQDKLQKCAAIKLGEKCKRLGKKSLKNIEVCTQIASHV